MSDEEPFTRIENKVEEIKDITQEVQGGLNPKARKTYFI